VQQHTPFSTYDVPTIVGWSVRVLADYVTLPDGLLFSELRDVALSRGPTRTMKLLNRVPRVFINYSHDSPGHADRVLALAARLRAEGIDCHLDQYETSPPEGWPRRSENQVDARLRSVTCTKATALPRAPRWAASESYSLFYCRQRNVDSRG